MSAGEKPAIPQAISNATSGCLELAHVLFTDIVGYSLLLVDEQRQVIQRLQNMVRELPGFDQALAKDELICIPTGDGVALACFGDPTMPVRYACQVASAMREISNFRLRMGIHTGPVYRVADINIHTNVAGSGMNIAQRVMDCGDEGHILLSQTVAEVLLQLGEWRAAVHDIGQHKVKHGVTISIFNLFTEEFGNPALPTKLKSRSADADRQLKHAVAWERGEANNRTVIASRKVTVGRTRERQQLHACFESARAGNGLLVCISGEPGIGKTTLVDDFLADLTTVEICAARGKCSERLAGTEA